MNQVSTAKEARECFLAMIGEIVAMNSSPKAKCIVTGANCALTRSVRKQDQIGMAGA
jgi:hypothetical protein